MHTHADADESRRERERVCRQKSENQINVPVVKARMQASPLHLCVCPLDLMIASVLERRGCSRERERSARASCSLASLCLTEWSGTHVLPSLQPKNLSRHYRHIVVSLSLSLFSSLRERRLLLRSRSDDQDRETGTPGVVWSKKTCTHTYQLTPSFREATLHHERHAVSSSLDAVVRFLSRASLLLLYVCCCRWKQHASISSTGWWW